MLTIRLIHDLGFTEEIEDIKTTRQNLKLTLSHIGQKIAKSVRAYIIHENGHSCDVIKGEQW